MQPRKVLLEANRLVCGDAQHDHRPGSKVRAVLQVVDRVDQQLAHVERVGAYVVSKHPDLEPEFATQRRWQLGLVEHVGQQRHHVGRP